MAKKRVSNQLGVYLNALPLGELGYKTKSTLTFRYKSEWLERANNFPISRSLPLREDPYEGQEVYAYFDNLLPDGISIRQRIAARMHAKSDQVFDLLSVVGRDCVGALQFVRAEDSPPVLSKAFGTEINESQIAEKLRNLRAIPLAASEEEDFRLSIAGAQDKTALLNLKGKWRIPRDATPTTHIFKPQIGELNPGMSFADSVENEWLCAKIVGQFGIPVTKCEISQFEDIKVLVVERFDRQWVDQRLIRIPQEDICQAMGVATFEKYESDGGPGIVKIMDLLNESQERENDRRNFLKTQVIFFLLAAIDGHAKNFSIRWGPAGFKMTPLYDILSAQPMIDRKHFQIQKLKMAMALGSNRHFKIVELQRRHFLQTAKACRFDIDEMQTVIDETLAQLPAVITAVQGKLPKKFPHAVADSIFKGMRKRAAMLVS